MEQHEPDVVEIPDATRKPTMTTAEVAPLFAVCEETLLRLARKGEAPIEPLRLGRAIRWPTARVLEALGLEASPSS